ncbi:MAG: glycosyltransferase [Alicyclobacillus sp.]|nr:glycosyltransferase [Alicyclobacillus sp.]
MKIAIVHDWLISYAGSERVVMELCAIFPDAPVYTSIYNEKVMNRYFPRDRVRTTFLQRVPGSLHGYQMLLPLMPYAFEALDLRDYDVVVSSSHAFSKGVLTRADTVHVCYCHTPTRYLWSHFHEYLEQIANPVKRLMWLYVSNKLRAWDYAAAQRVDFFVANSSAVQHRIQKYYHRSSVVVYPPVHMPDCAIPFLREDFYITVGRLVPYKRIDIAVRAMTQLGRPLIVVGDGPEHEYLKNIAGSTVKFSGSVSESAKWELLRRAKALIFCGEEDFGIVMVEALSCGCPVIALGRGGALDIVRPGINGYLFNEQSVQSLIDAVIQFERMDLDPHEVAASVRQFSPNEFALNIGRIIRRATGVRDGVCD